jgi:hypothetical protein
MVEIMTRPFRPRKKKAVKPVVAMKNLRIDERTIIQIPVNMPDHIARERYLRRYNLGNKPTEVYILPKEDVIPHEEPISSLEDLQAVVDDANLPEIE